MFELEDTEDTEDLLCERARPVDSLDITSVQLVENLGNCASSRRDEKGTVDGTGARDVALEGIK